MNETKPSKIDLHIEGQTKEELDNLNKNIINIVKALDKDAQINIKMRRKCDYCQKTLTEDDGFITIKTCDEVLDKCEDCQCH